jgi:hypothetical protein
MIIMNIFMREMKANRKALIIWSICMILFVLSGMSKYSAYSSGGNSNDILNKLPKTMRVLFGMGTFDVTSMSGFFAFLFSYIVLTVAIHAALLGSGILSKEERDKTTEFLIVKPVSRYYIITSKFLAALVNIVILNLVTLLSSIGMVAVFNKGKDITSEILLFYLSLFFIQLIFMTLGFLLAAFMKKPKASGSLATGILLIAYAIAKLTDLTDHLNALNILSPFKYFSYERIVEGNGLSLVISLLSLLITVVFSGSAYYLYQKRDLNI